MRRIRDEKSKIVERKSFTTICDALINDIE